MNDFIIDIISVAAGSALLLFRKKFASNVIEGQNRVWGFNYGDRERKATEYVTIIVGTGFLVIGILGVIGIIHFK